MRRLPARALLLLVPVVLFVFAPRPGASRPALAEATTVTFNYTGAAQTWTVPAGVTQATFDVYGAQGGTAGWPVGKGAQAKATLAVTAGATVTIMVGGKGGDSEF